MSPDNQQTIEIPDKYVRLGVQRGFLPTDPDDLRIIFEGLRGDGKSTLMSSMPGQLVLDFDRAAGNVYERRSHSIPIPSWKEYQEIKDVLIADAKAGTCPYHRVGFDTTDVFLDILDQHILEERRKSTRSPDASIHRVNTILEWGEAGAGYRVIRSALMKEFKDFEEAGLVWSAAVQLKQVTHTVGDTTTAWTQPWMAPTVFGLMSIGADMVAKVYSKTASRPIYAEVTLPNGTTKTRKSGSKTVTEYWLDVKPEGAITEEKRKIMGLDMSIRVPGIDGWAQVATTYKDAIQRLRDQGAPESAYLDNPEPEPQTNEGSE